MKYTLHDLIQARGVSEPLRGAVVALMAKLEAAEKERDALRAKIEHMERQEPVAWMGRGPRDGRIEFSADKPSPSVMRDFNMTPLYALPGAKGEKDV